MSCSRALPQMMRAAIEQIAHVDANLTVSELA